MTRRLGCDISHYQGPALDWDGLKAAGVEFAFAKAAQGTSFVDPTYHHNVAEMRRVGIDPGAYFFLEHGSPEAQARHYLATVGDITGIALALDVERGGHPDEADVRAFLKALRKGGARGRQVYIYTSRSAWAAIGNPKLSVKPHPLWDAAYGANTSHPLGSHDLDAISFDVAYGGWKVATVRQFSSTAMFRGHHIDADARLA